MVKTPHKKKQDDQDDYETIMALGGVEHQRFLFEQVYSPDDKQSAYAIYDMDKDKVSKAWSYQPSCGTKEYIPAMQGLLEKDILFLPSTPLDYGSDEKLWSRQLAFLKKWTDVPEDDHIINVQYIALTWLFDRLNELPYRRFIGDYGTGKSRILTAMALCSFRPVIFKAATTPATIFRMVEQTRGTICIDEANFSRHSDAWSAINSVLCAGYERVGGVIRCGEQYELEAFLAFSPKILASRIRFADVALESRCLTTVTYRTHRKDIPVNLTSDFFEEARTLRNMWLMWRFKNYTRPITNSEAILRMNHISPRIRQIIAPLDAVRPNTSFFLEYIKRLEKDEIENRQSSFEGQLIQIIADLVEAQAGEPIITIKELCRQYQARSSSDEITPRKTAGILKRLGFMTERGRVENEANPQTIIIWDELVFKNRCMDYGLPVQSVQSVQSVQGIHESQAQLPDPPDPPDPQQLVLDSGHNGHLGHLGHEAPKEQDGFPCPYKGCPMVSPSRTLLETHIRVAHEFKGEVLEVDKE
jgi:hypothetical protein